jgi:hypothetical protein
MSGQSAVGSGQSQSGAGCLIKPFKAREISSIREATPAGSKPQPSATVIQCSVSCNDGPSPLSAHCPLPTAHPLRHA